MNKYKKKIAKENLAIWITGYDHNTLHIQNNFQICFFMHKNWFNNQMKIQYDKYIIRSNIYMWWFKFTAWKL